MAGASEEMLKRAYELGHEYEASWGDCSQATIRALMEVCGEVDRHALRGMAGFHGGGGCDGSCGALCAGIYFLSLRHGRELEALDAEQ